MSKIVKKMKIMQPGGTLSDYVPIGAEAENINVDGESVEIKLNKKPYYYNNIVSMKNDLKLKVGDMVVTLGYYNVNDGGKGEYRIVDGTHTDDGGSYHQLDNNLYAELIAKNEITPEMFGAYGDGTHDDHNALIRLIKFITTHYASYNANNYESQFIKFNNKKYLNGSTITFGSDTTYANTLNINGNGAYIINYGFKFENNAGWKLNISNLNFANMTTAFEMETRNLEYGNYIFDNIEFVDVINPFIIDRQSCIIEIKNCIFRGTQSIAEVTNADKFFFHHNWIEPSSSIQNVDYKSMIKQNVGNEGTMYVYDNLFVPVGGSNCKELCWIEVNKHARIYNNRFGGENTNYHPLRIGSGFVRAGEQHYTLHPYVSFDHNDDVHGATSIIIESLAGNMLFTDNQGYIAGTKVIEWSDKVTSQQQAEIIKDNIKMLNLVIRDNVGTTFYRNGNGNFVAAGYLPSIPTNLYGIINRGLRAIDDKGGENAAYLEYTDTVKSKASSYTITIKDQPFKNINSASLGGRFEQVNTFALLIWFGYGASGAYLCDETYGLVTFELSGNGTVLTPNIHYFGTGHNIDLTINGNATVDITTLYEQDSFTLTFSTSETGKNIKYLHAQVFRPRDELSCFV